MTFTDHIKLSLIAGTISALLISGIARPAADSSLFFSHLFFGTAVDREYTPEDNNEDEVVFGCWIIEFFVRIFS